MTFIEKIHSDYFEWMYDLVASEKRVGYVTYRQLLRYLHDTEFTYTVRSDGNREGDGIALRYRYAHFVRRLSDEDFYYLDSSRSCSVLEMLVALAIRCEETIMDDPAKGDRTAQWFWQMVTNLGLGSMTDDHYDEERVETAVDRFLNREYEPDGRGGLFRIKNCEYDLRDVPIFDQLCWYLNNVVGLF